MTRAKILDLLERVGLTYVQAFVAAIVLTGPLNLGTVQAAALAGIAAVLNLAYRLLTALKPHTGSPLGDLTERVVVTFASSAVAALVAAQHYGLNDVRAAALGGLAAALAVAKAGLAGVLTQTPSLIAPLNPVGSNTQTTNLSVGNVSFSVQDIAAAIKQALNDELKAAQLRATTASGVTEVPPQPPAPPGT